MTDRTTPQEAGKAAFNLYHVDDCMYIAADSEEAVIRFVKDDGCWGPEEPVIEAASLSMRVTTANIDDGEKATPDTMTTVQALVEEHLSQGGTLPYIACFDGGM